jgi:hypothetical protein
MSIKPISLNPDDLQVESLSTYTPILQPMTGTGASDAPAICSCFGSCDQFCGGGTFA